MNMIAVIVLAIAVVFVIGFLSWWFSADAQARRAMRAVPVRPIGEAIEGEKVRLIGPAEIEAPLSAPLSGRPCAVWRVVVEERVRSGKNSYWRTLVDESEAVEFRILDGTGKAIVKATHVQAVLDRDMEASSGMFNDAGPALEEFLAERGHSSKGWVFNKTMRYREGVLEPGESVCVVGVGTWESDPEERAVADGYRTASQPKRLIVDAPADGPLLLSDQTDMQS